MDGEELVRIRLRTEYATPNLLEIRDTVVKAGPRAWKSAALLTFGDKATGEITGRTLRVQTWWRKRSSSGYGLEAKSDLRWSCDGDEISKLLMLLQADLPTAGTYLVHEERSALGAVARLAADDATAAASVVSQLLAIEEVRVALASSGAAESGAALVSRQRHRAALERLREEVADPHASEKRLQDALTGEWWLFGGRFVGQHRRRHLTSLDQLDIPLIRADGSLHVVELKRAAIPNLVMEHRNHLVPGPEVHTAVGQAMNYLRALDEQHLNIRQDFGIDVRRSTATIVIGHPDHCLTHSDDQIAQTLRTYNSHLARIEVTTYAELLAGATAALKVSEDDASEAAGKSPLAERGEHGASVSGKFAGRPKPQKRVVSDDDGWTTSTTLDPWAIKKSDDPWGAADAGNDPWAGGSQGADPWADEPPF